MQFIKRLKPMVAAQQNSAANTIYVDTDDEKIKVGTGASGTSERTLIDSSSSSQTFTGQILVGDGTTALPSYSFTSTPSTGIYTTATGTFSFSSTGATGLLFGNNVLRLGSGYLLGWSSSTNPASANEDTILYREAAGHLINRNGTTAQRFSVANTWTGTTNNETFSVDWQTSSNVCLVGPRTAAAGTGRTAIFGTQSDTGANVFAGVLTQVNNTPRVRIGIFANTGAPSSSNFTGEFIDLAAMTNTATSGPNSMVVIRPTYNQSSGTAANTDLLINRTETAVGSGAQNFFECQLAGAQRVALTSAGNFLTIGNVACATATAIPAGGTAGTGFRFSSTSNFGVFFGSGLPTLVAAKGSIYLRSDGSSTSTRLYVATDSAGAWTNVTTAA